MLSEKQGGFVFRRVIIKESLQICTGHFAVCGKSLISAGLSFHK